MIRVLVVDDDFMVARVHTGLVERVPGFTVVGVAHTGEDALAAVDRLGPDLVLLDIYLPDVSGLEVLRRLREKASPVDVLVVTASRDAQTVRDALRGGVVHYVVKPFSFDTLRASLERYEAALQRFAAAGPDTTAQTDVDKLFGALRVTDVTLPKGLNPTTADLVVSVLRDSETDLSAAECAERAGLSRVSTRRYLEYLAGTGRAEVRRRYGGTGRPEHRYRWIR
ncbi:response regulator [Asanoa siamensis]|uniref:Transcriptional regulatory protein n=1 Tax=Asanoa siamensis TaxID=926357 RepID=A0ABQ4CT43_9ACTN|nr:response regulator [Asanoa siamensis]GIF74465.1 transcriptional regulatory protein [Asanoa siamensis]